VREVLHFARRERQRRLAPHHVLDSDRFPIDPEHVEGVRLAADARRRRGASLYDDGGTAANVVALGGRPSKGDVQMAGQKHIDPFGGELLHRFRARPGASEGGAGMRLVEGMVRDEDGHGGSIRVPQQTANPLQFATPYPAAADGERPCGVGPDDDQLGWIGNAGGGTGPQCLATAPLPAGSIG
jgi:hypothetical protein